MKYPIKIGKCAECRNDIIAKNASFVKPWRKFCSLSCRTSNKNKNRVWTSEQRRKVGERSKKLFTGVKKSKIHCERIRTANLGSKSHFWKGGLTDENRKLRNSRNTKEWRQKVFERDNFTCQNCGARSGNGKRVILNADHIIPWSKDASKRFDVNNGRTLCVTCHRRTDTFGSKANSGGKRSGCNSHLRIDSSLKIRLPRSPH